MSFTSYQSISNMITPINSGSYISMADNSLLKTSTNRSNIWYGNSNNVIIELSIWDLNQTMIGWGVISGSINASASNSYLNSRNYPSDFSRPILNNGFIIYNNSDILINPPEDLASINYYNTGSYYLVYNMIRNVVGNQNNPLIINKISSDRTELKLLPQGDVSVEFTSFYNNEIIISDVYKEYIDKLVKFPVNSIYNSIKSNYQPAISILHSISSLKTDADIVNFITNIYEDTYSYSPLVNYGSATRIQGIKSYFFNYLANNISSQITFSDLDLIFATIAKSSIDFKFNQFLPNITGEYYAVTKQFVYDIIIQYYYRDISDNLAGMYKNIYNSPLKNALNIGHNQLYPIINRGLFIEDDGTPTLIIKLKDALPDNLSVGTPSWISNISISPIILNATINDPNIPITYKIGGPDFTLKDKSILVTTENSKYSTADLNPSIEDEQRISISKKIKELNLDYTNFNNFIIFSSAEIRLKIFKNKKLQLDNLNSTINLLNEKNRNYILLNNTTYPFYNSELSTLNLQIDDVIKSFDGYESYLYNSGVYNTLNGTFSNLVDIKLLEDSALEYDINNRDSLIKNTPKYILEDTDNNEYIIFLSMIGHFFDNIYIYISNLPSSKIAGNTDSTMISNKIVNSILEEMGWDITDILSDDTISSYNLTSSYSAISSIDRIKIIENRILQNLPLIYKTKGTQTSVDLLLACYGIPQSLLNIKEYGGYCHSATGSYNFSERSYLYTWNKSSPNDMFILDGINNAASYMFKVRFDSPASYTVGSTNILMGSINKSGSNYPSSSSISGSGEWAIGFTRTNENDGGNIYFRVGYQGKETFVIKSQEFPLFDGNVYSILLRKNGVDDNFDISNFTGNFNQFPRQYDLIVQRNNSGNILSLSSNSYLNYDGYSNSAFDGIPNNTRILIGGWFLPWNSNPLCASFDKLEIFQNVVSDLTFNDYVNNINSYSTDITNNQQNLLFRMGTDYPFNIKSSSIWNNANPIYPIYLSSSNAWIGVVSSSYNTSSCQTINTPIYPYQFTEIENLNTINSSYYGPNQFQNNKINAINQNVECQFDANGTSTVNNTRSTPSSNLLGIILDPQDFKNKDIVRQFGSYDLISTMGNPSLSYENQYLNLKQLQSLYLTSRKNKCQNTLFGEIMTVYRLYFNNSIFKSIEKLLPARANVFSGILISPTILERPKYQFKPINSEINTEEATFNSFDLTKNGLFKLTSSINYSPQDSNNPYDFHMEVIHNKKGTNSYPSIGYVPYSVNDIQLGVCINPSTNRVLNPYFPYSSSVHILKRWRKYKYSPNDDISSVSSSVYLYDYIAMPDNEFYNLVYTASIITNEPVLNAGSGPWMHYPNTFKNTSNAIVNNFSVLPSSFGLQIIYTSSVQIDTGEYFEIVNGYPRSHYSHRRDIFSNYSSYNSIQSTTYKKSELDYFPVKHYYQSVKPGQTFKLKGVTYPVTDNNITYVKNKYYITIGKKAHNIKNLTFITASFNPSSSFYTTISSSVDVNTLLHSDNPVYILTQDAIGILN